MSERRDLESDSVAGGLGCGSSDEELTRARLLRLATGAVVGASALGALPWAAANAAPVAQAATSVKRGGVLRVATDSLVAGASLDPVKSVNDGTDMLQGLIREGLSRYDANQVPLPNLVSWQANAKFTQYTLTVRRGVRFHDGRPFTSADVSWLILRQIDPKSGSSLQSRLAGSLAPSGVKVVDAQTVTLTLKQSDSDFMSPFARVAAMVVPAGTTDFETGIGTGPFKLVSYASGKSFEVAANKDYWQPGIPYLDGIQGVQISEPSTKVQGVLAGQTHVTEIDYQSVPVVHAAKGVKLIVAKNTLLMNVGMDQTAEPFKDPRVREALKRSVDREKIVQIAFAGFGTVAADVPVPTSDPQFPAALRSRTKQDLALARKLMAQAGHSNGLTLTLNTPSDAIHSAFSLAFAASVQGSPFQVSVKQSPPSIYWDKIWLHAPFVANDWNRRRALEALPIMVGSGAVWNESKFHDPHLDKLLEQGLALQGSAQDKVVAKALALVSKNSGELIPAYRHRLYVSKQNVQGLVPTSMYLLEFRKAWLA